jgi:hypothetical protein
MKRKMVLLGLFFALTSAAADALATWTIKENIGGGKTIDRPATLEEKQLVGFLRGLPLDDEMRQSLWESRSDPTKLLAELGPKPLTQEERQRVWEMRAGKTYAPVNSENIPGLLGELPRAGLRPEVRGVTENASPLVFYGGLLLCLLLTVWVGRWLWRAVTAGAGRLVRRVRVEFDDAATRTKLLVWVAVVVIVAMGLYPPWNLTETFTNGKFVDTRYGWIFSPPPGTTFPDGVWRPEIDLRRLLVQWTLVALLAGAAALTPARAGPGRLPPS